MAVGTDTGLVNQHDDIVLQEQFVKVVNYDEEKDGVLEPLEPFPYADINCSLRRTSPISQEEPEIAGRACTRATPGTRATRRRARAPARPCSPVACLPAPRGRACVVFYGDKTTTQITQIVDTRRGEYFYIYISRAKLTG